MIYEYKCPDCFKVFDVIKSVKEMNNPEACPNCGTIAVKNFAPSKVYFNGAKVEHAEYNPAFGCVVKNKRHRKYLAEKNNMVEVGNDFKSGLDMVDKDDKAREKKLKDRIEKAV